MVTVEIETKWTQRFGREYWNSDTARVSYLRFKKGRFKAAYYTPEKDIAFLYSDEEDEKFRERYMAADEWARRPYAVIPQEDGTALVVVPAWLDLHVGWLVNDTGSYRIYRVDHYALWSGLVPAEFSDLVELPELNLKIEGDHLIGPDKDLEEAWKRYRHYLSRRDEYGIKIKEVSAGTSFLHLSGTASFPSCRGLSTDAISGSSPDWNCEITRRSLSINS
jgi:hypothetical protein